MRRFAPLLALGLLVPALASLDAGAQRADGALPFLYEVRAGGAPSYLFGTFHLGVSLEDALPAPHRIRLSEARKIIAEMDIAALNPQAMMQGAVLPPGESLRAMMPPATWDALTREVGASMPPALLDRFRPWVPVTMLAETRIAEMGGQATSEPMDGRIVRDARDRGARVGFLETADQQLAIMNSIPSRHFVRELGALLAAYRRGDEEAMTRLVFDPEDVREMPEYYDLLFTRRNRAWMGQLLPELRGEGGLFVAVGLGHLLGREGLVHALRAEGLAVRRIEPAPRR